MDCDDGFGDCRYLFASGPFVGVGVDKKPIDHSLFHEEHHIDVKCVISDTDTDTGDDDDDVDDKLSY